MPQLAKGELEKVNDSLNKPKTKLGLDFRVLLVSLIVSFLVFLCKQHILSVVLMAVMCGFGKWMETRDPKIVKLAVLAFSQARYYDPTKRGK